MSNFEKVTSLFLILIGLSGSLIHTDSVSSFTIFKKKKKEATKVFWGDRFELMSKKKKSKERKTLSFGAKKKICYCFFPRPL